MLGRDLLASAVDEVLDAPGEEQVPVLVQRAQVAGAEPPVGEAARRLGRVAEVAAGDGRTVHPHLAHGADRAGVPVLVDDTKVHPGRPADRPVLQGPVLRQRLTGRLVRGLGHPVRGQQRRAERALQRPLRGRVEGSTAAAHEPQGHDLRARVLARRPVQEDLVDGRDRGEPRGGHGPHVVPERVRREPSPLRQQHASAAGQGGQECREQPVTVEERHHRDRRVVRSQLVGGADAPHGGGHVGVRQRDHLGPVGGARGEQDEGVVARELVCRAPRVSQRRRAGLERGRRRAGAGDVHAQGPGRDVDLRDRRGVGRGWAEEHRLRPQRLEPGATSVTRAARGPSERPPARPVPHPGARRRTRRCWRRRGRPRLRGAAPCRRAGRPRRRPGRRGRRRTGAPGPR